MMKPTLNAEQKVIVFTANSAWNIWNFRRELVYYLISRGHLVWVLAPKDSTVGNLESLGCKFKHLKLDAGKINIPNTIYVTAQYIIFLITKRPDFVLGFTIKPNIIGAFCAKITRTKFIPNITGLGRAFMSNRLKQSLASVLYRYAFSSLDLVFFQNAHDQKLFLDNEIIAKKQAKLLPGSGIDLVRFAFHSAESQKLDVIFLMISRVLREKGILEFFEAATRIKESFPHAHFRLVGSLPFKNKDLEVEQALRRVSEKNELITYVGAIEDIREEIRNASCVVLPSYREGAPRCLIEASAIGRAVIAANVPGSSEVVANYKTGFLCDQKSSASLEDAMISFLKLSSDQRKAMGIAGRKKMENEFDVKIVIERYMNVMGIK